MSIDSQQLAQLGRLDGDDQVRAQLGRVDFGVDPLFLKGGNMLEVEAGNLLELVRGANALEADVEANQLEVVDAGANGLEVDRANTIGGEC